jgi:toxin-antitoxin system PIN domain toxin
VFVVDANVLLYAVNEDALHHDDSRSWLDGALSGAATVGFSWMALLAFVRLSTKVGLFPAPLHVADAIDQVGAWTSQRSAVVVGPTERHASIIRELLEPIGTGGNLVNDAHLAALAIEHGGTVVSYDRHFGRFPRVKWRTPADVS